MRTLFTSVLLLLLTAPLFGQVPGRGWRFPVREIPQTSFTPLDWGVPAAAHLNRRTGFSASIEEIDRIGDLGFDSALEEMLAFEVMDDSEMEAGLQVAGYPLVRTDNQGRLRASVIGLQQWWLYRMLHSRRQLLEKMTFFWHDHFATSVQTVDQVDGQGRPLMLVQNATLRAHALGNFKEMVRAIARDPAMTIWLDNFTNVVGQPNENWARELLELFTMGEGSGYTEQDIQEAARAFTGWTLQPPRCQCPEALSFRFNPRAHDFGPKTFLGRSIPVSDVGMADGDAAIDIVFDQPVVARYIAGKLWEAFVYPNPSEEVIQPLANAFRDSNYDIKTLVRAVFTHPHFLSDLAYRAKIKGPVELLVSTYRELGVGDPRNIPRISLLFGLGQNLFLPPDVGGWTTDVGWINTGTILARYNFMTFLTSNRGQIRGSNDIIAVQEILEDNQLMFASSVVDYFVRTLVQGDISPDSRAALEEYMNTADDGTFEAFDVENPIAVDKKVRGLIFLVSLLPAYQLN